MMLATDLFGHQKRKAPRFGAFFAMQLQIVMLLTVGSNQR